MPSGVVRTYQLTSETRATLWASRQLRCCPEFVLTTKLLLPFHPAGQLPRDAHRGAAHQGPALPGGQLLVWLAVVWCLGCALFELPTEISSPTLVQWGLWWQLLWFATVVRTGFVPIGRALNTPFPALELEFAPIRRLADTLLCLRTPNCPSPSGSTERRPRPASHDLLHRRHPLRRVRHVPAQEGVSMCRCILLSTLLLISVFLATCTAPTCARRGEDPEMCRHQGCQMAHEHLARCTRLHDVQPGCCISDDVLHSLPLYTFVVCAASTSSTRWRAAPRPLRCISCPS